MAMKSYKEQRRVAFEVCLDFETVLLDHRRVDSIQIISAQSIASIALRNGRGMRVRVERGSLEGLVLALRMLGLLGLLLLIILRLIRHVDMKLELQVYATSERGLMYQVQEHRQK